MEWNKEQICLLIDLYREFRVLWDPSDHEYKNRNRKHDAWSAIAAALNTNKEEVEGKMRKLPGQFYREDRKKKSGAGTDEASKWFGYKLLLFVRDKTLPNHSREVGFDDDQSQEVAFQTEDNIDLEEDNIGEETSHPVNMGNTSPSTIINAGQQITETTSGKRMLPECTLSQKKRKPSTYDMAQEAFHTMKSLRGQMTHKRDEYDAFGECVAHTLRNLSKRRAQVMLKHEINSLLLNAELGLYDEPTITVIAEHENNENN